MGSRQTRIVAETHDPPGQAIVTIHFHIAGWVFIFLGGVVVGGVGVFIFMGMMMTDMIGKMFGWR
jgi:hypothetical protein